ncbi:MAG: hypothetical protein OXC62_14505 [Aestuariivita sp.]|nr:hypothetical protein [Aestuariivita sp.]
MVHHSAPADRSPVTGPTGGWRWCRATPGRSVRAMRRLPRWCPYGHQDPHRLYILTSLVLSFLRPEKERVMCLSMNNGQEQVNPSCLA